MAPSLFASTRRAAVWAPLLSALAAAAFAQPALQVSPASHTYNFNPADAPADRTVVVTNTGNQTANATVGAYQTGQPSGATANAAAEPAAPAPNTAQIYSSQAYAAPFAQDRVIVVFKEGQTELYSGYNAAAAGATEGMQDIDRARDARNGAQARTQGRRMRLAKLRQPSRAAVLEAIQALRQDPNVAYVQPDYVLRAMDIPNDPSFSQQWHLNNSGQTGGTADADIDAPEAWVKQKTARSIVVGVIDSGIDWLHPDLAANIWTNTLEVAGNGIDDDGNGYVDDIHGYDFVNNDGDPMDDNMHGTHCAGAIAAAANNGLGVAGTAWEAKLMGLKFLDASGSGFTSAAIGAVNYAKAMGVKITSNSWGGGPFDQALMDAIAASGALFVASAGNNNSNNDAFPQYPAGYNLANIISVAATDASDILASFSNFGATTVDIAAPGVGIYSTTPREQTFDMMMRNVPAMYAHLSGTSMAAPLVTGAAALILQRNPTLAPTAVKTVIMNSADFVPALSGMCVTAGRLNLDKALARTPASWVWSTPNAFSLAPGQSRNVTLTASPAGLQGGAWNANVAFSVPGVADKNVAVTANVASCVTIQGPASINFGNAWTGQAVQSFLRLKNTCNSPLTVTGITSSHPAFSSLSAMPIHIPAFSSADAQVRMQSATAGTFNGTLTVASNATNAPNLAIPATGKAFVPPKITVTPASLSATAASGAEATVNLTVGNTGPSDLVATVAAVAAENGTWLSATPASFTLAPNTTRVVAVKMSALALYGGSYGGEIRITHNDPNAAQPYKVPVSFTVTGIRKLAAAPLSLNFQPQTTNRNAAFTKRVVFETYPEYSVLRVADMDNDGDLDIVAGNDNIRGNDARVSWFENTSNHGWKFKEHVVSSKFLGSAKYFYEDTYPVDLDKDGDMDVIGGVAVPYSAGFLVWFEKTPTGWTERPISANFQYLSRVKPADLDKDGDIDIAVASSTDDKISWFRNNGSQSFTEVIISQFADNAIDVDAGDVDGDGDVDLVSASYNDGRVAMYRNNGAGVFIEAVSLPMQDAQHSVLYDLDKDGDLDILASGLNSGMVWFRNNGVGSFTPNVVLQGTQDIWAYWVQGADMDLDGDRDLIICSRNGLEYSTDWYENNGSNVFNVTHRIANQQERAMTPGDFDGDGDIDVAMGTYFETDQFPAPTLHIHESKIATNSNYTQLVNAGTAPTTVTGLAISSNRFTTTAKLPFTLAAKETVSVNLNFVPGTGANTGTLTVASNASDNPSIVVNLNGAGTPAIPVPGKIQAEDYKAGDGIGYKDLTAGNTGGQYRTDNVDIQATTDAGGGFNVGWTQAGEWLSWDVSVATAGTYAFTARLASATVGTKNLTLQVDDGTPIPFSYGDASGWQSWKDQAIGNAVLSAGNHVIRLNFNSGDLNVNYINVATAVNAVNVPARIQAEDYRAGGAGIGYHDLTAGNTGGAYRTDNVDIQATGDAAGGAFNVGWTEAGEWLAYDINVAQAGAYDFTARLASANAGTKTLTLMVDDVARGSFNLTEAPGWQVYRDVKIAGVALTAGIHVVKIQLATGGLNINWLDVTKPATGTSLPARIQAEDYKAGGEGTGYHDLTAGNTGGQYRTDNVDIEVCSEGGFNVGWTQAGEWLAYDVNVAATRTFAITARLASGAVGTKNLSFQVDNNPPVAFTFSDASGWQSWKDVVIGNVSIPAGNHVIRLNFNSADVNVNWINAQ